MRDAEGGERRQFDHGLGLPFKDQGQHDHADRRGFAQAGLDARVALGNLVKQDALFLHGALADQSLAHGNPFRLARARRVGGQQTQGRLLILVGLHLVDGSLLRLHQRGQLGKQHLADGEQVALALQHARKFGEVRLQPILLLITFRGHAQVGNHRVEIVLEIGDFAARIHLNRTRQIALGHSGRNFRDRAHLRGQSGREQVHVAGQILPSARCAGHVGLAAEPAIHADFARHVGDLLGENGERVSHVVDRVAQGRDFAFGFHG